MPREGMDFLTKSAEHVRGCESPDRRYCRTPCKELPGRLQATGRRLDRSQWLQRTSLAARSDRTFMAGAHRSVQSPSGLKSDAPVSSAGSHPPAARSDIG